MFIGIKFVPKLHVIDRSLVVYTYLLTFIANIGEKLHFSSAMNITMLLMWYQTIQNFRHFFLK